MQAAFYSGSHSILSRYITGGQLIPQFVDNFEPFALADKELEQFVYSIKNNANHYRYCNKVHHNRMYLS